MAKELKKKSIFKVEGGASDYYKKKSLMDEGDVYYEWIEEKDIILLQKSFSLVVLAPFVAIVFMKMMKMAKKDVSFTESFMFGINKI